MRSTASGAAVTRTNRLPVDSRDGQLRLALRSHLLEGRGPVEAVGRLDGLLGHLGDLTTATLVLAVVDRAASAVELVVAGHPWPVLIDPAGRAEFLTADRGRLLGLPGAPDRPVQGPLMMPEDSCLVLYTDGAARTSRARRHGRRRAAPEHARRTGRRRRAPVRRADVGTGGRSPGRRRLPARGRDAYWQPASRWSGTLRVMPDQTTLSNLREQLEGELARLRGQ